MLFRSEEGAEVVFSTTLLSEVLETRKGVLTGDAMMDARFSGASSVQDGNLRSAIGVPFVVGGQVRGLIFLGTVDSVDVFTEPDLDVLLAIAAEAEIAIERAERDQRIEDNLLTRAHLSRFFSPALVEQASIGQINPFLPSSHEVTVLFARVRGFAQAANAYSPEQVMATLSEHFDAMMDIVFMHGGVCDKFIGDGLMALWNVPVAKSGSASRALRAGLEMVARVEEMNVARKEQGLSALHISVALHTGPVVFGEIGAARRQEFTAIGDTVDAAARLCDQVGPAQVVATESTLKSAGDSFETSEVARTEKRSRWPFGAGAKPEEIPARTVITERE